MLRVLLSFFVLPLAVLLAHDAITSRIERASEQTAATESKPVTELYFPVSAASHERATSLHDAIQRRPANHTTDQSASNGFCGATLHTPDCQAQLVDPDLSQNEQDGE